MNMRVIRLVAAFSFISLWSSFQVSENKMVDEILTKTTLKQCDLGDVLPQNLFTLVDAEKILGEKAHLSDSTSKHEIPQFQFKSTFTADRKDATNQKIGNVYFMFEDYKQEADALKTYLIFKNGNQNHVGFSLVKDLGDAAFFQTDNHNFYLIIVRKGKKMIRIKVNKLTQYTSLKAFNETAKKITEAL